MTSETQFSPRVLIGSNGKPEGDETYACKVCGACVTQQDLQTHTNWHESEQRRIQAAIVVDNR